MAVRELPFVVPGYGSGENGVGGQRVINMMPLSAGGSSKVTKIWAHTPALESFIASGDSSASRGFWTASNGRCFHVAGSTLWEILVNGTRVNRGTLASLSGPVQMVDNGTQMLIVDGVSGRLFTFLDSSLSSITDEHFPQTATHCAFTSGYFVVNEPRTIYFRRSDLRDGASWDLEQTASEGSPDEVTCLCACNLDIWTGGPRSCEVFYATGDIDQIFQRVQSAVIGVGVAARYSMQSIRGRVLFVSEAGAVYMSNGLQVSRISPPGLEKELQQIAYQDAVAFSFEHEGHAFYAITIDSAERTFVFDLDEQDWHERSHLVPESGLWKRWRGTFAATAFGECIVGDSNSSAVYKLNRSKYEDDKPDGSGTFAIRRQADGPDFFSERSWIAMNWLELECVTGQGTLTGQGSDPKVMFAYSDDCGLSWSNERWASLGKLSERQTRAKINIVGRFRQRRIRVSATDPVPHAWQRLWAELEDLS